MSSFLGIYRGRWRFMAFFIVAFSAAILSQGCSLQSRLDAFVDGRHVRAVWVKDVGDSGDVFAQGQQLLLMGFDSRDGKGQRRILPTEGRYFKPLLSPDGCVVIYTDIVANQVFAVDFNGGAIRRICPGVALDTWQRQADGTQWVYVRARASDPASSVSMVRLDDPGVCLKVWSVAPVETDNFQVSADGKVASGQFPWPEAGLAILDMQYVKKRGQGCWTSLSPDNSYMLWRLDGAHRNIRLFDGVNDDVGRTVSFNDCPGLSGREIYHPRWSNDARFVAITGPYVVGSGPAGQLVGETGVEVYIGKFDESFRKVTWFRLTNDEQGDYYPDVWITPTVEARTPTKVTTSSVSSTVAAGQSTILARLVKITPCPEPRTILPYKNALVADHWQVEKVVEGQPISGDILVASWRIIAGKKIASQWHEGETYRLTVQPYDTYGRLSGQRLIMDYEDATLPLYYDPERAPISPTSNSNGDTGKEAN